VYRGRFAPSPTGDLHLGSAATALIAWCAARAAGGRLVLRVEDIDRPRVVAGAETRPLADLRWLGLDWDEGPDIGGPHGPYRQSERSAIYQEHAARLVKSGAAYACFCTAERLASLREQQKAQKAAVMGYDGLCRRLDEGEAEARRARGEAHVIRLAMPEDPSMVVTDLLRGEVRFERPQMDDQVLLKSDGFPTYHLANVVDDHLMAITHVVRAEEWLSSLPKHVQLYRAFGWELPVFCHLPLLRNADKSKISKRKNPVSLNHYRRAGYFPEAMVNFLALMSFSMPEGREEFTLEEFIAAFDLERISLGGPVFDLQKLTWLNGRYLHRLSTPELIGKLHGHLLSDAYLSEVLPLCRERIDTLEGFFEYASFFFVGEVPYDDAALRGMVPKSRTANEVAKALRTLLEQAVDPLLEWNAGSVEAALKAFAGTAGWPAKELFMTVRLASTGRAATPPLFETLAVLGKEVCRRRLRAASDALLVAKSTTPAPQEPPA
jgi:glutamyl-tRNA synthetase